MSHVVKVSKKGNESTPSLIRRFTRAVKLSKIIARTRDLRYSKRSKSEAAKKKDALRRIAWQKEMEHKEKMGR